MSAISIIRTTYNSETWLEKVLWGYTMQSYTNFELIIADDGSTTETKNIIEKFQKNLKLANMFGFWTSSSFNVRNNNKILKRFLDIETIFCFEY